MMLLLQGLLGRSSQGTTRGAAHGVRPEVDIPVRQGLYWKTGEDIHDYGYGFYLLNKDLITTTS